MKNNNSFIFYIFIIIPIFLFGCRKTPIPINQVKDISIVYCIIDPTASDHYVRIQKAFITDGDAYEMADQAENNLYVDSLSVRMYLTDKSDHAIPNMDWMLEKVLLEKDSSGDFTWEEPFPVFHLHQSFDQSNIYNQVIHLEITNNTTGKKIIGSTQVVNDFFMSQPKTYLSNFRFSLPEDVTSEDVIFDQALNGKRYELAVFFEYDEFEAPNYSTPIHRETKWLDKTHVFNGNAYELPSTPPKQHIKYNPSSFYGQIDEQIPINNQVKRMARCFRFEFKVCTPSLHYYKELCSLYNNSINSQEFPLYTNFTTSTETDDVRGIIACRYYKTIENILIDSETLLSIAQKTHRNFVTTL